VDIIGYSKLATDQQVTSFNELYNILHSLEFFRQLPVNSSIIIPTGDGFALVFNSELPLAPLQVAIDLQREVKRRLLTLPFRAGIHCGVNSIVANPDGGMNVVGTSINYAARVMSLGDVNHILVSNEYYQTVIAGNAQYAAMCHLAGEYIVKHGITIKIFNVFIEGDFGNPTPPRMAKTIQEKEALSKEKAKTVYTPDELFDTPPAEFTDRSLAGLKHKVMKSLIELFENEDIDEQSQRFWLAFFQMDFGDYEGAKKFLERFVQDNPRDDDGHYTLACCYANTGEKEKALRHLEKAILLDPINRHDARIDDDFKPLWNNPDFISLTT
jgi:tetratricopeptide (TPR) repeat protein